MFKISSLYKNKEFLRLFSVLVDQAFMSITALLTTVVLARTYSKNDYAEIVLLFSITVFVLGFQNAMISKPYAINRNDFDGEDKMKYTNFTFHLKLYFTLLIIAAFPILYYFLFEGQSFKNVVIFITYIVANTGYYFIREIMLSERKVIQNLFYGISSASGILALLAFIFFIEQISIDYYILTVSVIYILPVAIYLGIHAYNNGILLPKKYRNFMEMNWEIGKWMIGSNVLFFLSSNIYPWILLYVSDKEDIAVYGVLMSVASLVNPVLMALSSYLLPIFVNVNQDYNLVRVKVKKWTLFFCLMGVLLVCVGVFGGQFIIDLLFGEKYKNLGIIIIYPFLAQAVNVVFHSFKLALNAIKRTDVNFWILIPRSILAVALGYFLTESLGLIGVFYTMIAEVLLYQMLYYMVYRRVIKVPKLNF